MLNVYQLNTSIEVLAWVMAQEAPLSEMTPTDEQADLPCNVDCQPTIKVAGNRAGIAFQVAEGGVKS